jgi:hypothetical protein
MKIEVVLTHTRSTKGTHFFEQVQEGQAVKSLYVQKADMPQAPERIRVTVEEDK